MLCVRIQNSEIEVSREVANSLMEVCGKAIKQFHLTDWASHGNFSLSRDPVKSYSVCRYIVLYVFCRVEYLLLERGTRY